MAKAKTGAPQGLDLEVLRKLHAANPEVSALLRDAGLPAPEPPAPTLSELCQQHILSLPQEIQEALTEPPVVTNPAQQVLQERFKEATGELRTLIATQVDLQGKITKAKSAYSSLLAEMQSHMQLLEAKQAEVQELQHKLRAQMQVQESTDHVSGLLEAVKRAGVTLDAAQMEQLRAELSQLAPTQESPFSSPPNPELAGDVHMSAPAPTPQEAEANSQHQRAIISNLQEELRVAREATAQLRTSSTPSQEEPATKKLKSDPPPEGEKSTADGSSGLGEGSRSRSPKNRTTQAGDEVTQKL
jgi:hypothetical protein